jgi:hypothetical protein
MFLTRFNRSCISKGIQQRYFLTRRNMRFTIDYINCLFNDRRRRKVLVFLKLCSLRQKQPKQKNSHRLTSQFQNVCLLCVWVRACIFSVGVSYKVFALHHMARVSQVAFLCPIEKCRCCSNLVTWYSHFLKQEVKHVEIEWPPKFHENQSLGFQVRAT